MAATLKSMMLPILGDKLRADIKASGFTIQKVAIYCGVSDTTISTYINTNEARSEVLEKICILIDKKPAEYAPRVEEPKPTIPMNIDVFTKMVENFYGRIDEGVTVLTQINAKIKQQNELLTALSQQLEANKIANARYSNERTELIKKIYNDIHYRKG